MRCDYCGRAIHSPMHSKTSWVPRVDICGRTNCEPIADRVKEMYVNERSGWAVFDETAHIYVDAELPAGWEDPADPYSATPRRSP